MVLDPVTVLRSSHERLNALLAPLSPDEVRQPAYPSEWSIARVASHLGSSAQITELAFDAGLAGTGPVPREANQPIWEEWNAKAPEDQARDAVAADARLIARIDSVDEATRRSARFPIWLGEVDLVGLATARLMEHALHTWDIAVALDPSATVAADAVPIVLTGIRGLIRYAAKPQGRTGRVRVSTERGDYLLSYGESGADLAPVKGDVGDVTATVGMPAEALVRLVYGRLDEHHRPPVESSGITVDELRSVFPGI